MARATVQTQGGEGRGGLTFFRTLRPRTVDLSEFRQAGIALYIYKVLPGNTMRSRGGLKVLATIDLSLIVPHNLYPPPEAARLCRKSPKTLANDRSLRRGIPVSYVGSHPYYKGADILAYFDSGRVDFNAPKKLRRRATKA